MPRKAKPMPTANRGSRLTTAFAVPLVVCIGMAGRPALGQAPAPSGRAPAPETPVGAAAHLAPAEGQEPISFARALSLAAGQNPQIALANEQIHAAFAQLQGAKVLWLPSIQAGASYVKHDGTLQASDGTILQNSQSSLEAGLGTTGRRRRCAGHSRRIGRLPPGGRGLPASHRRANRGPRKTPPPPQPTTSSSWQPLRTWISCGRFNSRRLPRRRSTTRSNSRT